jgi:hypothetical protein
VRKMAEQLLIDDMQAIIKKGRYHLWSYKWYTIGIAACG